jgi:hypothetical protein
MLEKVIQTAERAATSSSRRKFLGSIGRGAFIAAVAAAGLLAHSGNAQAAGKSSRCPPRCYKVKGRCVCPR